MDQTISDSNYQALIHGLSTPIALFRSNGELICMNENFEKNLIPVNLKISRLQDLFQALDFQPKTFNPDREEQYFDLTKSSEEKYKLKIKKIEDGTASIFIAELNQCPREEMLPNFFFKRLMKELPLNIYFKDKQSRFILVSDPMLRYMGVSKQEDLKGKTDFDIFADEHARQAFDDEQEIMRTRKAKIIEEKEVWEDGRINYVLTTKHPLIDEQDQVIGTFGISQDITQLKTVEIELKQAYEQLNQKSKKLEQALHELTETQAQLIQSEKMRALGQLIAGIAHEINTPLGAIAASADNIRESLQGLTTTGTETIRAFNDEDFQVFMEVLGTPLRSDNLLSSREKRKRKKEYETTLKAHHSDASKIADFLVYLDLENIPQHWINNSRLGVICATAKTFISGIRNAANIQLASEKAGTIVRSLKTYTHRNHLGQKERVDLPENIETILTLNHNKIKHGIKVIKNYDEIPQINAYPDQLGQVWNNLITNAIHAMNGQGDLTITIEKIDQTIRVSIQDNGSGIPEDVQKRIFEPFFTTKAAGEGTGMGLDIVKKIVENHGGNIDFESTPGQGTCFHVTLPIN